MKKHFCLSNFPEIVKEASNLHLCSKQTLLLLQDNSSLPISMLRFYFFPLSCLIYFIYYLNSFFPPDRATLSSTNNTFVFLRLINSSINLAMQLDCRDFKSEISHCHLAKLRSKAVSADFRVPELNVTVVKTGKWLLLASFKKHRKHKEEKHEATTSEHRMCFAVL